MNTIPTPERGLRSGVLFSLLWVLLSLAGCSGPPEQPTAPVAWQATYSGPALSATLQGTAGEPEATLTLTLTNTTAEALTVDLSHVDVMPRGGIKSTVAGPGTIALGVGESQTHSLKASLIHHNRYYQEFGWVGPPAPAYQLHIADSLLAPAVATCEYEGGAVPGTTLYALAPAQAWQAAQVAYWQQQLGTLAGRIAAEAEDHGHEAHLGFDPSHEPFVHASLPELTCGGINLRATAHQQGDTLWLGLRMVNHSPFTVGVPLAQLSVHHSNTQIAPIIGSLPPGTTPPDAQGIYWLGKGQRLEVRLGYLTHQPLEQWWLAIQNMYLQEIKAPAFHDALPFQGVAPQY